MNVELVLRREKGKIWSPIRKIWLNETPEETVRQEFLIILVNEYGFTTDQIGEELEVTGRGKARCFHPIYFCLAVKCNTAAPYLLLESYHK